MTPLRRGTASRLGIRKPQRVVVLDRSVNYLYGEDAKLWREMMEGHINRLIMSGRF